MNKFTDTQLRILEKAKITCRDVIRTMDDRLAHELPLSLNARVDAHVAGCSCCQEFERTYTLTVTLASSLRPEPISRDVQNRLRRSLNSKLGIQLPMVS